MAAVVVETMVAAEATVVHVVENGSCKHVAAAEIAVSRRAVVEVEVAVASTIASGVVGVVVAAAVAVAVAVTVAAKAASSMFACWASTLFLLLFLLGCESESGEGDRRIMLVPRTDGRWLTACGRVNTSVITGRSFTLLTSRPSFLSRSR